MHLLKVKVKSLKITEIHVHHQTCDDVSSKKNWSHFMGKPLVFFSFMGSTPKKNRSLFFPPQKKPTGNRTLLLVVFLGTPMNLAPWISASWKGSNPPLRRRIRKRSGSNFDCHSYSRWGVGRVGWGWLVNLLMGWWRKTGWYFFGNLDIDDSHQYLEVMLYVYNSW